MNQSRLKSPVLWTGLASIVFLIMGNYGFYDVIGMPEGTLRAIVDTIFGIAGIVGVTNNPTDKVKF